jgi:hypothetical protein
MAFYVYENWQAGPHKTVIHEGSCGFCNHGAGRAGGYDPSHAEWHGPFITEAAAEAFSEGCQAWFIGVSVAGSGGESRS